MKFVSLVSSGIDSPVATFLLSKKAEEIILVHADGKPFVDNKEIEKFTHIAKHLKKNISSEVKTYIVPHGNALNTYKKNCNSKFTCIFCKRMLLRYAEKISGKENADAIIMGDSLGQVASQTLQNLRVVDQATILPVLRPLIGLDKEDIIQIAKEIGTYYLSILPSDGCSAVPIKPATKTRLDKIEFEEEKINVDDIVGEAIIDAKLIVL